MLYSVVTIILAIYTVVSPFLMIRLVKFGVKLADKPEEAAKEPVFRLPERKKTVELSAQEKQIIQTLENVDIYDGTAAGQKEILV